MSKKFIISDDMRPHAEAAKYDVEERAPDVLLPYQKRWLADESEVKISEKSRRIGISWVTAAGAVLTAAASRKAGGMNVWYMGYNKDMSVGFILDCAQWAQHFNQVTTAINIQEELYKDGDEDKSTLTFSIKFASGYRITALSSAAANLRSRQGKVILDEAAFHPDLEAALKAAIALLMWGGLLEIISTHNGIDNLYNEQIKETLEGKKPYSLHKTTFKDALAEGLYKRICMRTGKQWSSEGEIAWEQKIRDFYGSNASEELDCIPSQSSGSYFSRTLVEMNMSKDYPVITFHPPEGFVHYPQSYRESYTLEWLENNIKPLIQSIPSNLRTYYGMDFGRTIDLSIILPGVMITQAQYYSPFSLELRDVPFQQQKQILFYLCDEMSNFQGGSNDARGNGQSLAEEAMQRYGATRIFQIMPTQSWYLEYMPKYKDAIEMHEYTMPYSKEMIDDHRAVQLINGIPGIPNNIRTTDKNGNKRHGDSAIAGCLLKHATLNCASEFDFMSADEREFSDRSTDLQGFMNHG